MSDEEYQRGKRDAYLEIHATLQGFDEILGRFMGVLQLPMIFYAGGEVTAQMRRIWKRATGVDEMTTKIMCDTFRTQIIELQQLRLKARKQRQELGL